MKRVLTLLLILLPLFLLSCNKPTQSTPQVKAEAAVESVKLEKKTVTKTKANPVTDKQSLTKKAAATLPTVTTPTTVTTETAPIAPAVAAEVVIDAPSAAPIQTPESLPAVTAAAPAETSVLQPVSESAPSKSTPSAPLAAPSTNALPSATAPIAAPPTEEPTAFSTPPVEAPLKVTGSMQILFNSRTFSAEEQRDNPDRAIDTYSVALSIPNKLRIAGDIKRLPRLVSKYLGKEERPFTISYGLTFYAPVDGKERKVGSMAGNLIKDLNGQYKPAAQATLRIHADKGLAAGEQGAFGGTIQGQAESEASSVAGSFREYFRNLRGKKVSYKASHTDPLEFRGTSLAPGPLATFPAATLTGNLDYDYDTGNWLTNGITMRYSAAKRDDDKLSGSIKWIEDPQRSSNGLGRYEFNLRFNEERFSDSGSEEEFFAQASDEEQFFIVDKRVPTIAGKISYKDTFSASSSDDEPLVVASSVNYDLSAEKVELEQLVSFLKLWLLIVGPVNDE